MSTEAEGVEAGFKQVIAELFARFYQDTDDHTKWGDGAIARFRTNLAHARRAREQALKMIGEELQ